MAGRKKENRTVLNVRVARGTPESLKKKAKALGLIYNDQGATGKLLDEIAANEIILIPKNQIKSPLIQLRSLLINLLKVIDSFTEISDNKNRST